MREYAISFSFMQDASTHLREFMAKRGLSQEQMAARAHVSQSTVSRVLEGGSIERHSSARHRLFTYARITELAVHYSAKDGIKRVVEAFNRIWDGSDTHATAVVGVIDALAGLGPMVKPRKGRSREGQRGSTQATTKKSRFK
jgi:predicted XRE-type DNA-binding protein